VEVVSLKESAELRWIADDDDIVITEHEARRRDTLHLPHTATDAECEAAERRDGLQLPRTASDAECEAAEERRRRLQLTFAYCGNKAQGQGTTACFAAGGGHAPAVCGEVLDVAAGRPVYWKATVVELNGWFLLGAIGNAQPAGNSHQDPTNFGWASLNSVYIAGQYNGGHGGWITWQAGDVAVFKLEAQRLSMRVRRLGDQTFTMDTNGAQNLRIHVRLSGNPTRVQLSQAELQDMF
jgi:hypothetical protein